MLTDELTMEEIIAIRCEDACDEAREEGMEKGREEERLYISGIIRSGSLY